MVLGLEIEGFGLLGVDSTSYTLNPTPRFGFRVVIWGGVRWLGLGDLGLEDLEHKICKGFCGPRDGVLCIRQ